MPAPGIRKISAANGSQVWIYLLKVNHDKSKVKQSKSQAMMASSSEDHKVATPEMKDAQPTEKPVPSGGYQAKFKPVGENAGFAHAGTDWDVVNAEANSEPGTSQAQATRKGWKHRLFKGPGLGIYR